MGCQVSNLDPWIAASLTPPRKPTIRDRTRALYPRAAEFRTETVLASTAQAGPGVGQHSKLPGIRDNLSDAAPGLATADSAAIGSKSPESNL